MSTPQDDAAIVADMVREFDFPRYAASLFAPPEKRRAMLAVAAFDLEIQRIPDQVSQPLPGEVRLQWWTDAIEGVEHGGVAGHPVAAELLNAVAQHGLPREPLLALVSAHKFDLYDEAMPTLAALEVYCDDICGSSIRLNAALLGDANAAPDDLVQHAGRAVGLARTIARLPHDAAHGRCFLPVDHMAAHGVMRHQVLSGDESRALREARDALIDLARQHLRRVRALTRTIQRSLRPAFLPLATLTRELDALEKALPFALVQPPSHLRLLTSQWWMMR